MIEFFQYCIDLILHADHHLNTLATTLGPWLYLILFLVIFCETGLVVTPFLPGDSLLFALGALSASANSSLELKILLPLLIIAGVLGDSVNYAIGDHIGPRIFKKDTGRWLRKDYLLKTRDFFKKYGGKAIILGRFMPIIRTFAPFVAGVGTMHYTRFLAYNLIGSIAWVCLFLLSGYYFGNIPTIKQNFHIVIITIVLISLLPIVIEYIKERKNRHAHHSRN